MSLRPAMVATCFLPAGIGLMVQVIQPQPLAYRLLVLGLLIMCAEQAHMARVDLQQIVAVRQRCYDPRLANFSKVVAGTIAVELTGFYMAAAGHPGWGMLVILGSLTGFNLMAGVRLEPLNPTPIRPAGIISRLDVLLIDAIALGLAILWVAQVAQLWAAALLLGLSLIYEASKLVSYVASINGSQGTSTIHITDSTQ